MQLSIASLVHGQRPISDSKHNAEYYYPPSPAFSHRSNGRSYSDASCGGDMHSNCSCESHSTRLPSISSLLADCPVQQEPTPRQSPQMQSISVSPPSKHRSDASRFPYPQMRMDYPPSSTRPLYAVKASPPTSYATEMSTSAYDNHIQAVVERYPCDCCNKSFSRPSSLRIHKHSHTGERPFVCSVPGCERAFSVRSNMRRHMRVHQIE